jgi:hypothetical protein
MMMMFIGTETLVTQVEEKDAASSEPNFFPSEQGVGGDQNAFGIPSQTMRSNEQARYENAVRGLRPQLQRDETAARGGGGGGAAAAAAVGRADMCCDADARSESSGSCGTSEMDLDIEEAESPLSDSCMRRSSTGNSCMRMQPRSSTANSYSRRSSTGNLVTNINSCVLLNPAEAGEVSPGHEQQHEPQQAPTSVTSQHKTQTEHAIGQGGSPRLGRLPAHEPAGRVAMRQFAPNLVTLGAQVCKTIEQEKKLSFQQVTRLSGSRPLPHYP